MLFRSTAKVCIVIGTPEGSGTLIREQTAIIAVHRAVYVIERVFFIEIKLPLDKIFFLIILSYDTHNVNLKF